MSWTRVQSRRRTVWRTWSRSSASKASPSWLRRSDCCSSSAICTASSSDCCVTALSAVTTLTSCRSARRPPATSDRRSSPPPASDVGYSRQPTTWPASEPRRVCCILLAYYCNTQNEEWNVSVTVEGACHCQAFQSTIQVGQRGQHVWDKGGRGWVPGCQLVSEYSPRHMFPNYAFRGWTLTSAVASAESASRLYSEALVRLNSQRPRWVWQDITQDNYRQIRHHATMALRWMLAPCFSSAGTVWHHYTVLLIR